MAALGSSALAAAPSEQLCPGFAELVAADGRLLGHLPYAEVFPDQLVTMPPGFALDQPCRLQRDAAAGLTRLLAAAAADGIATLRGVSCYRSVARQRSVFCSQIGPGKRCRNPAERARSVGPPGYSEHATGYALDFGVRPSPGCADLSACIATTAAGTWLLANAPRFGFELSFPAGNAQQVTWEPWHWRWVGASADAVGAAQARFLFGRARAAFPAAPMVETAIVAPTPDAPPRTRLIGPY